jgi:plastocyanin
MKKLTLTAFVVACTALAALDVHAENYEVIQKDLNFSPKKLTIKVGDTVSFKNEDVTIHNVYSLSDANTFDLGGSPKGKVKTVTFSKPGMVTVECAVHTTMKMMIEIK